MNEDELREIGYEKGLDEARARGYDGEFAEILAYQYADGYLEGCEGVISMYRALFEQGYAD